MSVWEVAALAGLALVAYAVAYWLGPDLAGRVRPATLRRGIGGTGAVALTFDDGPGPDTSAFLDALAAAGARVTFFVIWERARSRPDLIARMLAEGHDVALHGRRHVHAATYLAAPWRASRDLAAAWAGVCEMTGGRALRLFRPPWGARNAGQAGACRRLGLRVALWSLDGRDYGSDMTAEGIADRVGTLARDGDIVDLHDAGGAPGAPARTLAALPDMIARLRAAGLEPVPLSVLLARGEEPVTLGLRLWEVWEGLFARVDHAVPIGHEGMIAIAVRDYRGPALEAPDGRRFAAGTRAGEIHLGNYAVSRLAGGVRETIRLRRMLNAAIDDLAVAVAAGAFPGVELFFGTTLLGRAAAQVGLHAKPVTPTLGVRVNTAYMRLLMRIYHPQARERMRRSPDSLAPMLCWVTRAELVQRHAQRLAQAASRGPTAGP